MSNIRKLVRRCTAWLLCMAMAVGCFQGLSWTAFAVEETSYEAIKAWTFDSDAEGWQFNSGWSGSYKGGDLSVAQEDGQLKLNMDYSQHSNDGWMQAAVSCGQDQMPDLSGAVRVTMDVSYEPSKLTDGAITVKVSLGEGDGSVSVADSQSNVTDESTPVKKAITIDLSKAATQSDFVICIVGQNTTYNGAIWLDNIRVEKMVTGSDTDNPPETPDTPETIKRWTFDSDTEGWQFNSGWSGGYKGGNLSVAQEGSQLKLNMDYSEHGSDGWMQAAISCGQDQMPDLSGAKHVTMDISYEPSKLTDGALTVKVSLGDGDGSVSVAESQNNPAEGTDPVKKTVTIDLSKKATQADFVICIVGQNTTYKGAIWLDNIRVEKDPDNDTPIIPEGLPVQWTFDDDITGWFNGGRWPDSVPEGVISHSDGALKVDVDYSQNADLGWAEVKVDYRDENGFRLTGANYMSMDIIFNNPAAMTGGLSIKVSDSTGKVLDRSQGVDLSAVEDYGNGLKKVTFVVTFDPITNQSINQLTIGIVGNNTSYQGSIWLDNITFDAEVVPDVYVDSTVSAQTLTSVAGNSNALVMNGTSYSYATEVQLADPNADENTVALYQYLKAVGESGNALFGHMEDTVLKAGSADLSDSDTKDLTGSLAAINGLDCGGLFSGFAGKYNARHSGAQIPDTTEGNIKAAALLSNEAIAEGAIMTLSSHMPNFAYATEKDSSAIKSYDRYDYTTADSYNLTGDCMNQILPDGAFNPQFTAYLDLVAEYAQQVNGPILFRPFHENTGSWFWWGKAFCDAETYKSVFRYTVEYLRDTKGVHNLIYVYGPGSEAATIAEYNERYPGDAYVDMVGFDTYDGQASADASYTFMRSFEATVRLTDQFAKEHNKLFAVTETGITNDAMKKQGNARPQWFTEILDIITKPDYNCAYYMVWSNYDSNSNYYMPFAISRAGNGTLHGHELMDPFIQFYNDQRSIFASDQKDVVYGGTKPTAPTVTGWDTTGYFTAPIAGSRILSATEIKAQISAEISDAVISVTNGETEIVLATTVAGRTVSAMLTADILAQLGEAANGKILLRCGGEILAEITAVFNIPEKARDPYMVDDFESYYGVDSMLTASWATNKATGSNVTLTLDDACAQDGYAMKFDYSEQSGGWAGATITKDVDWSACNALQFWTVPDGKQQKTVIQIEANTCYEVYLNEYDEYNARAGQPTLVTIPFSEFCQRDTAGNPKGGLVQDCGSVSSFGLWVNAIDNSYFDGDTVSGTIWYDNITAVTTDKTGPTFETPGSTPVTPVDPVPEVYTITATAGIGGTITPTGSVTVSKGNSQGFIITPNSGYVISNVVVDGVSVGSVSSYTFENITESHTIDAAFSVSGNPTNPVWPSQPVIPGQPTKPGTSNNSGNDTAETDAPKTVTVTDPVTGTVTETTTYADGSQLVVETKADGTVTTSKVNPAGRLIETVIQKADGSNSTTTVDTYGKTTTVVTLSANAVTAAQSTGAAISLPMPVISVGKDTVNAPTITLNTGSTTGTTKVEIPVANVSPGTVAILIKPDGTEEVIKKSAVSAGGLILSLDDRTTVKIVDRNKDFADVSGHWSTDAIAFVSSRDIFSGTGANTFSPDATMTRAMLATVLARFDGVDTTGGTPWYEKGIEWAMNAGVSDGSDPEREITREQMVVMLYRYAGSPVASGSLSGFTDADKVSSYALTAAQWAVEQGIITGKPDNMLDPQGSATRAEVAAILMRFCSKMV